MNTKKPLKIEFAPGCFDSFDGTQEELDEMIAEITRLAETGELFETGEELDLDDLSEEDEKIVNQMMNFDNSSRKLQ